MSFRRLRADGVHVVDRSRPRNDDPGSDLQTNHGGVAVVAAPVMHFALLTITGCTPTTFELVCTRVAIGHFTGIIVVIYRPGSWAVHSVFFDKLSTWLDIIAAYQDLRRR